MRTDIFVVSVVIFTMRPSHGACRITEWVSPLY